MSRAARSKALPFTPLTRGEQNIWRSDGLGPTHQKAGVGVSAVLSGKAPLPRPGTGLAQQMARGMQDRPESSLGGGRNVVLPGLRPGIRARTLETFGDEPVENGLPILQERLDSANTSESERQQVGADGQLLVPICPVLYLVRDPKFAPADYANLPRRIVLDKSQLVLGRGRQSDVVFDSRTKPSLVSKSELEDLHTPDSLLSSFAN